MRRHVTRRAVLASLGATSLAGCLGGAGQPGSDADEQSGDGGDSAESGPPTAEQRHPLPMEPARLKNRAVSGGPPKDGIPSIDDPTFEPADAATEKLEPGDPVFGIATGETAKAYPQRILVHHEICNDSIGGRPIAVTYCPLTGTAMGFERGETTFGVSGRLTNNNLIMYDRATETWWPQVLATAIPGPWNDDPAIRSLREFRVVWTTWERWTAAHPGTRVLSTKTGFAREYGLDPYGSYNPRTGYYSPESDPRFPAFSGDRQLARKRVVIGARSADGAAAFLKDRLRAEKLIDGELGGSPVVAVYEPTLDTGYVFGNPEDEQFEYRDGQLVDEAGETYAPSSPPGDRILAFDAMWFAWSGFYPETTLYA